MDASVVDAMLQAWGVGVSSDSFHHYPFYTPRFWHGMRPKAWWGLLRWGHFRISPSRWGMAVAITLFTPFNTLGALIQACFWGRRLAASKLHSPPVFIIGHWRSGTTLLHELLVLDERLSSPSTFQCFAPEHFLVTEWFFRRFCRWMLPAKRPMDNMQTGWDRPQEDEFALLVMGVPSPYRRLAFPNLPPVDLEYLDTEGLDEPRREAWGEPLVRFLKAVSWRTERPLVVKSPTHTGRIATLARIFPGAKFIHLTRNPETLFPSTVRLWQSLDAVQALQLTPTSPGSSSPALPSPEPSAAAQASATDGPKSPSEAVGLEAGNLEEYVIECLRRMYAAFHRDRDAIPAENIVDVRYEDLVADPVAQVESIYSRLRLGDFESVRESLMRWVETEHSEYRPNRHRLPEGQATKIRTAWRDYFDRYGY